METFAFELKLTDSVSAPGKKAAAAVAAIEKAAKKTHAALSWHKEIEKTEEALRKISKDPVGLKKYIHAQKELLEQRKKINKAIGRESFGEAVSGKLNLGKMFSAAALGDLFAEGLVEGIKLPIEMFAEGLKEAFKAIGAEQELRAGYSLTLGKHGGAEAREDAERFSKKTAFTASQVQEQMLPLFRAGIKGDDARTMYASATDLAAGQGKGSDPEAVAKAADMFARIQQKGGITSKQLSSVGLGEMNVPAFYKALGLKLGVDAKSAEKLASRPGGVDPKLLRNTIVEAVNKQQGGIAGTGGEKAGKSLPAMWNKLSNAPEEFLRKLADSDAPDKLAASMGRVLEKLDPAKDPGKKIMAALSASFEWLAAKAEELFSDENIDTFSAGVESACGYIGTLGSLLSAAFQTATDFAQIWVASKLVDGISSIGSGIGNISTTTTSLRAGLNAALSPVMALTIAFEAWRYAFEQISTTIDKLGGIKAVMNDVGDFVKDGGMAPHAEGKGNAGFDAMKAANDANLALAYSRPSIARADDGGRASSRAVTNNTHAPITVNVHGGNTHEVRQAVLDAHQHAVSAHERAAHEGG